MSIENFRFTFCEELLSHATRRKGRFARYETRGCGSDGYTARGVAEDPFYLNRTSSTFIFYEEQFSFSATILNPNNRGLEE